MSAWEANSRAAFINMFALKCGVYSRAAFNRINTVHTFFIVY